MADKGIIFSAPMVRALLAGTKTQTRRLLKLPTHTMRGPIYEHPKMGGWAPTKNGGDGCFAIGRNGEQMPVPETVGIWHQTCGVCLDAPYQVGDRLYVREAAQQVGEGYLTIYRADYPACVPAHFENVPTLEELKTPWRPSIHMPRAWSRLTLTVTEVRVQRLQEISEADAEAEGYPGQVGCELAPSEWYAGLWNMLHGEPGERWADNPWIVAVSFSVEHRNIDAGGARG